MTCRAFYSFIIVILLFCVTLNAQSCRYIPSDAGWPSHSDWNTLNSTIGGRLISTVPQASVCYTSPYSTYNEKKCEALKAGWDLAETFEPHPAEIMNAYYQNQSCDPFSSMLHSCELGNYAVYSINVTGVSDVTAGINFATKHNIRLVIKATGHDYTGKSSGFGALALWTWNLKSVDINREYESEWYSGPAIKLGSGMIAGEAYAAAHSFGYRLVGGECASVSLAGGYTQGGGHSMLTTAYGMAADQVLEWEVVTTTGEHLVATPEQNSDVYWALCGGGGGTFGVVLSMTAKIYPDGPVAGASLVFPNTDNATYWEAISKWFHRATTLVGENNTIIFVVQDDGFDAMAITLPDQPVSAVDTLMGPYINELVTLGINHSLKTTYSNNYVDHFNTYFGPLPYSAGSPTTTLHNRIIPLSVTNSAKARTKLMEAIQSTVADGNFILACIMFNVANASHPNNAVLPAWRDSVTTCNINAFWNFTAPLEQNLALKQELVDLHVPALEAATPGSGVYLNEMDPWYKGDWKKNLYGDNYERLLGIKHMYDPSHVLWGQFSVGSDEFLVDGSGRLCPV